MRSQIKQIRYKQSSNDKDLKFECCESEIILPTPTALYLPDIEQAKFLEGVSEQLLH